MSDNNTPSQAPVIPVHNGGGLSFDAFNEATGVVIDDTDPSDAAESQALAESTEKEALSQETEQVKTAKEFKEDAPDESKLKEDEEDESEETPLEDVAKDVKKGVRLKTNDGKEFTIPEDAVILKKIDGEIVEVKLSEHLDLVAGEHSIAQRLGKISSLKEEVTKIYNAAESRERAVQEAQAEIMKLCESGRPEEALVYLAEQTGMNPADMYKQFLGNVIKAFDKFKGQSPEAIEAFFANKSAEWYRSQAEKMKSTQKQQEVDAEIGQKVVEMAESQNVSLEEFQKAEAYLVKEGKLNSNVPVEEQIQSVVEHALVEKLVDTVRTAIEELNPKLLTDRDLVDYLLMNVKVGKDAHSVEDVKAIISKIQAVEAQSVATNLSKNNGKAPLSGKAPIISKKNIDATKEKKVFNGQGDLLKSLESKLY